MVLDKYSIDGKVVGKVEVNDGVFSADVNDNLIYELVRVANSNIRQGTHSTKRRAEVNGGGSKPWRQKGTGRARHGSIRSPQWKGGGVVFGPKPKAYQDNLPKKMKEKAIISLFSLKVKEGAVKVVEDFSIKEGKTREIAKIGKALQVEKGVLITEIDDNLTKRATRNIPWFTYNNAKRISSRDIFYSKTIVLTESAVNYINNRYSKG